VRRPDGTRVRATLHADGARVGIPGLAQHFEGVKGSIAYDDAGLRGEGLDALLLGRPVEVSVAPERADDGHVSATVLDVSGRFDAIDLGAGLDARLGRLLAGSSIYHGHARLPQDQSPLQIDVQSDLAGTAVRMPAPLAKDGRHAAAHVHARFPKATARSST
jgi:uncharacterized protein YhdP